MMRSVVTRRVRRLLVGGALGVALLLATGGPAAGTPSRGEHAVSMARTGKIAGTVARPTGAARKRFRPSVRLFRLTPTYDERAVLVPKSGRFSLRVPPGLYAVVATGWKRTRPATTVALAKVRAGRTVRVKTARATPTPPSVRVSVGGITSTAPGAPSYWGKATDEMTITDLVQAVPTDCDVPVVVDRKYDRAWKEILKELNLQTTRNFPPATRAEARQALRTLNQWAPTHRLTGNVDTLGESAAGGTFRIVDMKTGRTTWQGRVDVSGPEAYWKLSEALAKAAVEQLCAPKSLVIEARGTFVGSDDKAQATVTASIRFEATGVPGEKGNYKLPTATPWNVESYALTRTGSCNVTPNGVTQEPQPANSAATFRNGRATVFLVPALIGMYSEVPPPDSCNQPGGVIVSASTFPGLVLVLPLRTPTRFTGQNGLGSYDVEVTVTPG